MCTPHNVLLMWRPQTPTSHGPRNSDKPRGDGRTSLGSGVQGHDAAHVQRWYALSLERPNVNRRHIAHRYTTRPQNKIHATYEVKVYDNPYGGIKLDTDSWMSYHFAQCRLLLQ